MPNLTMQQASSNSCGAACLLVAAKELGVTQRPHHPPYMFEGPLELDTTSERAIYGITAGGTDGYSMPDGIARAAQVLGLRVEAYMSGCMVPRLLEWKYPSVRTEMENLDVDIHAGIPVLDDDERMLVAVGVGLLGLHWVLYRPDGTYMDPAHNQNHAGSLWGMSQLLVLRYIDTGVYMVVSREAAV